MDQISVSFKTLNFFKDILLESPPGRADPTGYPDPTGYWVGWVVENRYLTQRWVGQKF